MKKIDPISKISEVLSLIIARWCYDSNMHVLMCSWSIQNENENSMLNGGNNNFH